MAGEDFRFARLPTPRIVSPTSRADIPRAIKTGERQEDERIALDEARTERDETEPLRAIQKFVKRVPLLGSQQQIDDAFAKFVRDREEKGLSRLPFKGFTRGRDGFVGMINRDDDEDAPGETIFGRPDANDLGTFASTVVGELPKTKLKTSIGRLITDLNNADDEEELFNGLTEKDILIQAITILMEKGRGKTKDELSKVLNKENSSSLRELESNDARIKRLRNEIKDIREDDEITEEERRSQVASRKEKIKSLRDLSDVIDKRRARLRKIEDSILEGILSGRKSNRGKTSATRKTAKPRTGVINVGELTRKPRSTFGKETLPGSEAINLQPILEEKGITRSQFAQMTEKQQKAIQTLARARQSRGASS